MGHRVWGILYRGRGTSSVGLHNSVDLGCTKGRVGLTEDDRYYFCSLQRSGLERTEEFSPTNSRDEVCLFWRVIPRFHLFLSRAFLFDGFSTREG